MLAASTLVDYFLARWMASQRTQARRILAVSLILNIGLLLLGKYYYSFNDSLAGLFSGSGFNGDFLLVRLVLPLGVSFYVLKKIAYMIDVAHGTLAPTTDLVAFGVYVSFFPQVIAGPIDRAQKLLPQLAQSRTWKRPILPSIRPR